MSDEVTLLNENINGNSPVVIRSANVEPVIENNINTIPIPQFNSPDDPITGLLNMKIINKTFTITGFIVKNSSFSSPFDEYDVLEEFVNENRKSTILKWRNASHSYEGMVKKVAIVDKFDGDISTLNIGEVAFEVQIIFIVGKDFSDL